MTVPTPEVIDNKAIFDAVRQLRAESPGISKAQVCDLFREAMPGVTDKFMCQVRIACNWLKVR